MNNNMSNMKMESRPKVSVYDGMTESTLRLNSMADKIASIKRAMVPTQPTANGILDCVSEGCARPSLNDLANEQIGILDNINEDLAAICAELNI